MSELDEIKELAQAALEAAKNTNYNKIRLLVNAIKELDLSLLKKKGKTKTAAEFFRISKDCEKILEDAVYPIETSQQNILGWLADILSAVYELDELQVLYNGTVLEEVLLVLHSGGMYGLPNACFFLNKKAAKQYANASAEENAKDAFKKCGADQKNLNKLLSIAKPIVLEFDAAQIEIKYRGIDPYTSQPEFEAKGQVPLSMLTEKSKKEIIKKLGIEKGDGFYKILYP